MFSCRHIVCVGISVTASVTEHVTAGKLGGLIFIGGKDGSLQERSWSGSRKKILISLNGSGVRWRSAIDSLQMMGPAHNVRAVDSEGLGLTKETGDVLLRAGNRDEDHLERERRIKKLVR